MDGLEVLKLVRTNESLKRLPVVILSSSREESDLARSWDLGVNAYVVKPVDVDQFFTAVKTLGTFWALINQAPDKEQARMPSTGTNLGPLRILMVEDSPEDAELLSDQLLDAGLEATFRRVEGESALRAALRDFAPDIVLSDLSMPEFSGHQALRVLREQSTSVPFIFVSGTIGEETAVQALRDGANDYIIKHNPTRLRSAVARAIREARTERERQRVEGELMRAQRLESLALLAAGLSQDLRNILQPLLIVPELMIGRSDDPQLRHLAEVIAECGRRGHEMAESMLSFVRGSRTPSEQVSIAGRPVPGGADAAQEQPAGAGQPAGGGGRRRAVARGQLHRAAAVPAQPRPERHPGDARRRRAEHFGGVGARRRRQRAGADPGP